ncbi:hypothetical protein HU200_049134 [Digitaria exilis]|uniref:Uncharacterized protein n=1 Tax=Digitaria exilis TaxID=1010633 RepID=A0A835B527_9POAL|nr:hypothetical protein HU200_049134 [Digitaria exilis]
MDGIEGLLARDFGVRPQGKAAPMAGASSRPAAGSAAAWSNPVRSTSAPSYDDLFGAPAAAPASASSFDSLFGSFSSAADAGARAKPPAPSSSSGPVFDDDIFDTVPGLRPSKSSSARYDDGVFGAAAPAYDDVFANGTRASASPPPVYDEGDFLGGLGGVPRAEEKKRPVAVDNDLLGGFGRKPVPVEEEGIGGAGFDDLIPGFAGSSPPRSRKANDDKKMKPPVPTSKPTSNMADDPFVVLETASSSGSAYASPGRSTDPLKDKDKPANSEGKTAADNLFEEPIAFDQAPSDPLFTSEINGHIKDRNPTSIARDSSSVHHSMDRNPARQSSMEDLGNFMPKSQSARYSDIHGNGMEDQSPRSTESEDDIWLTVSEIPLFTQPTTAPPPFRSPPRLKQKLGANANGKGNGHARRSSQNHNHFTDFPKQPEVSSADDLEGFAMGKPQMPAFDEEFERSSSDREERERQERLEQEREMELKEEMERERIRLEKENELEQQRERERQRQAVERATKEARDRAAAEARANAERAQQRAAVQRAQQEARERAAAEAKDRAARVVAEAKERAAAEAKERADAAERAAAERAQQEARRRAERAAVERAAAEARERQAAAAAAAAREKQSTPDDLESFFGMDARASSAPKQRASTPTVDSMFGTGAQARGTANGSQRAASTSASVRKAPSASVFGDDLSDLFGAPAASSDAFQEVEGESEERRRARLERHQRTRERAAKALAEKNERDMQIQREQAERDRIGDTLDFEIKRWSAGKEGNLRALLSTLQYILWAECGWQAVSLTDLITGAAVKKQYRKATLCIHPDKVQQKGATLQQKYIAEKVFDILKEAWNKFNSEELF